MPVCKAAAEEEQRRRGRGKSKRQRPQEERTKKEEIGRCIYDRVQRRSPRRIAKEEGGLKEESQLPTPPWRQRRRQAPPPPESPELSEASGDSVAWTRENYDMSHDIVLALRYKPFWMRRVKMHELSAHFPQYSLRKLLQTCRKSCRTKDREKYLEVFAAQGEHEYEVQAIKASRWKQPGEGQRPAPRMRGSVAAAAAPRPPPQERPAPQQQKEEQERKSCGGSSVVKTLLAKARQAAAARSPEAAARDAAEEREGDELQAMLEARRHLEDARLKLRRARRLPGAQAKAKASAPTGVLHVL